MLFHAKNAILDCENYVFQAAEQGISNLSVPKKHWSTCADAIATWPVESQPKWFRLFHKKFVVTEDRQIHTKTSSKIYLTPVKTGSKTTVERNDIKVEEEEYVEVGKGPSGQSVVLDREHLEQLVMQLLKEKEVSPSKRRKNSTPQKLTQLAELATILSNEESCSEIETPARRKVGGRETISPTPPPKSQSLEPDGASCYSTQFPIPPTPGRRTPNEDDDLFMDLESNSLMWLQTPHAVVVPDEASVAPTDFSSLTYSSSGAIAACQVPMGMLGSEFGAAEYSNSSQRHVSESMDEETSLTGFDIVPPDEEEEVEIEVQTKVMITRPPLRTKLDDPNQRASRKRTRHERVRHFNGPNHLN
uniref:Uncharacterized protein n=1 Tax=Caenorhabditis japonica TaxID=281687 RepID=A0A8R1DEL5_CAEJA